MENDNSRTVTPEGLVPDKYKHMLKVAKNKFKSKSEVPANHMLIKGSTSSFGDVDHMEQEAALQAQVNSLQ